MFIGDVGLRTRSIWWNRDGRPRSATSSAPLTPTAASAACSMRAARTSSPASPLAAATSAEPAARPPVNR